MKIRVILVAILLTFLFSFLTLACFKKAKENKKQEIFIKNTQKLKILSTTSIVNDLVKKIGGKRVFATSLMGVGIDPHSYRAKEEDARLLYNSDIIFYNGLDLEAKLSSILEKLGESKNIYALSDGIPRENLIQVEKGIYDPHIWFQVSLWKKSAIYVAKVLKKLDQEFSSYYDLQLKNYLRELDNLDIYIKQKINELEKGERILVTAHDAFAYFGKAYGIKVVALQGISTLAQPGVKDIENLANFIIKKSIPAVFLETSLSERTIISLQASVFSKGWALILGGELFTDALGDWEDKAETYIDMFKVNVERIIKGLSQ